MVGPRCRGRICTYMMKMDVFLAAIEDEGSSNKRNNCCRNDLFSGSICCGDYEGKIGGVRRD